MAEAKGWRGDRTNEKPWARSLVHGKLILEKADCLAKADGFVQKIESSLCDFVSQNLPQALKSNSLCKLYALFGLGFFFTSIGHTGWTSPAS